MHVNANGEILWKVNIDLDNVGEDFIKNFEVKDGIEGVQRLKAWHVISQVFSDAPKVGHLHIVVQLPLPCEFQWLIVAAILTGSSIHSCISFPPTSRFHPLPFPLSALHFPPCCRISLHLSCSTFFYHSDYTPRSHCGCNPHLVSDSPTSSISTARSPHQIAHLVIASVSLLPTVTLIVHCYIPSPVHRMVISSPSFMALIVFQLGHFNRCCRYRLSFSHSPTSRLHPLSPRVPTHLPRWHPLLLPFQMT